MTRWVPLSELMQPVLDRSVKVSAAENYSIAGVYGFGRGVRLRERIAGTDTTYASLTRLVEGDVVYSKVKAFEGAVAVVDKQAEGRFVSPEFPVFTPSRSVHGGYLKHFLGSGLCQQQLAAMSSGIGARRERVSPSRFLSLTAPLPQFEDQARIAAHLDAIVERLPSTASERQWSRREQAVHDQIVDGAGGELINLEEILSARAGRTVDPEQEYRVSGVYSFGRGLLERGTLLGTETKYKSFTELCEGDIVYSKLGAFENAVACVTERFVGSVVSPEFPVFEVADDVEPEYLIAALTTQAFAATMSAASTGVGARQRRVSPGAFLSLRVPIPRRETQERTITQLRLLAQASKLRSRARELRAAVLPAARNEIFSSKR